MLGAHFVLSFGIPKLRNLGLGNVFSCSGVFGDVGE